jgi:CheY-like chemotaxis protein
MDGFEAVRRFRSGTQADFETPLAVPIVALTANALAGDEARCLAAGFDDYMRKPFKQAQLENLLDRWAGRRSQMPCQPPPPASVRRAVAADADTVLDLSVLDRIRDMEKRGAERLLERLIKTYLATAAKLVADADAALESGDAQALRHAVHTLKSSSANLGATVLAQHFAGLESHARARQIAAARRDWPAARGEYERAATALQAIAAGGETVTSG